MRDPNNTRNNTVLLSTAYYGPVQWYTLFLYHDKVIIENDENFNKQSFRNRCQIYSANGRISLSVPVVKGTSKSKKKILDIKIDYSENWQKIHYKTIESAYRNSPFFDFFFDDISSLLRRKHEYLWELNTEILNMTLGHLDIKKKFVFSGNYKDNPGKEGIVDARHTIHPKKQCKRDAALFIPIKYKQVFDDKFGFIPDLSIMDLLFNEGPNSLNILQESIKHNNT